MALAPLEGTDWLRGEGHTHQRLRFSDGVAFTWRPSGLPSTERSWAAARRAILAARHRGSYDAPMPRILVLGAASLVGVALRRRSDVVVVHCLTPRDGRAPARPRTVRVEDAAEVATLLATEAPDIVLYCHAVCDVGRCEEMTDWAYDVNVGGVANLLGAVSSRTRVVYVSSDHVFGDDGAYAEADAPRPISAYGRTRVAAEELVLRHTRALVVRPGLAVGPSENGRTGHMDWLRHRAHHGLPISIVADEGRSAVWADALAERLVQLAESAMCGVRHVPAERLVSRPELARHLMLQQGITPEFSLVCRADRPYPHLGRIELCTQFADRLAAPLPSVVSVTLDTSVRAASA